MLKRNDSHERVRLLCHDCLSMKIPSGLLIAATVMIAIALVIAFFYTGGSPDSIESLNPESPSTPLGDLPSTQTGEGVQKKETFLPDPEQPDFSQREDDIAVPVEGNPLLVTLAYYPELGQISIERYDSKGQPTGKPLKSGTSVQIPNPNVPGEKIYFTVP